MDLHFLCYRTYWGMINVKIFTHRLRPTTALDGLFGSSAISLCAHHKSFVTKAMANPITGEHHTSLVLAPSVAMLSVYR